MYLKKSNIHFQNSCLYWDLIFINASLTYCVCIRINEHVFNGIFFGCVKQKYFLFSQDFIQFVHVSLHFSIYLSFSCDRVYVTIYEFICLQNCLKCLEINNVYVQMWCKHFLGLWHSAHVTLLRVPVLRRYTYTSHMFCLQRTNSLLL